MKTFYHLHLLPSLTSQHFLSISNESVVLLPVYADVKAELCAQLSSRLVFINPLDFISPSDVVSESLMEREECGSICELLLQKYKHRNYIRRISSLLGNHQNASTLNQSLLKSIFPSVSWTWHSVVSAEIFIRNLLLHYPITSFTAVYDASPVDDYAYFSSKQLSPIAFSSVCTAVLSYISDATPIQISSDPAPPGRAFAAFQHKLAIGAAFIKCTLISASSLLIFAWRFCSVKFGAPPFVLAVLASLSSSELRDLSKNLNSFINIPGRFIVDPNISRRDAVFFLLPLSVTSLFKIYTLLSLIFYWPLQATIYLTSGTLTYFNLLRFFICLFRPSKSQLFVITHGGAYGIVRPIHSFPEHFISDLYLRWGHVKDSSEFELEPVRCTRAIQGAIVEPSETIAFDLKVIFFFSAYPPFLRKLTSEVDYHSSIYSFMQSFLDALPSEFHRHIVLRPYPVSSNYLTREYSCASDAATLLSSHYPHVQLDDHSISGHNHIESAPLVVYTYLAGTGFFQRLQANLPFLIVSSTSSAWIDPDFSDLYQRLVQAHIIFTDPLVFSNQFPAIIRNPFKWWASSDVVNAITEWRSQYVSNRPLHNFLSALPRPHND